ncbi:Bicupin, oxalate decarboxylase/oxidase [Myriangium duriaei CBS 260.36]|uniref:Bicupin, oxalate decarboxylase/oxidase n=1 Tax=Myriangium duriaei CBS 260.36 TaxID=1168546 RepID=A0A9P4J316_9PEZI|nr:Bicupin, oxalate decarboxylase/oxidase [Myriangium duriaei CBS 260.36]
MRFSTYVFAVVLAQTTGSVVSASPVASAGMPLPLKGGKHLRPVIERRALADGQGAPGQPIWGNRGAPISGGTNQYLDNTNPDNLGAQSTDNGVVVNLKWSFSDSKTRALPGGWTREQVVTDLPASKDIAAAQQHLTKGTYRELHWHRVAEWGFLYKGQIKLFAVDQDGKNQVETLDPGDYWYFPKGSAHGVQGLADQSEYLLVFDDGNFDASGTTFMVDDWIAHTPKSILAKNFGVNASVFDSVPKTDPYLVTGIAEPEEQQDSPYGKTDYVYFGSQKPHTNAPGGGGTVQIVDTTVFPTAKTIASSLVTLEPGALRELHWHPNADEWLYFLSGNARATVFIGGSTARTFDFSAGDTAVFPDNSGHYVENTSKNETLVWLELYKSDRVQDISLTQWLALTPIHTVAEVLNISTDVVKNLKKEKQLIIAAN